MIQGFMVCTQGVEDNTGVPRKLHFLNTDIINRQFVVTYGTSKMCVYVNRIHEPVRELLNMLG